MATDQYGSSSSYATQPNSLGTDASGLNAKPISITVNSSDLVKQPLAVQPPPINPQGVQMYNPNIADSNISLGATDSNVNNANVAGAQAGGLIQQLKNSGYVTGQAPTASSQPNLSPAPAVDPHANDYGYYTDPINKTGWVFGDKPAQTSTQAPAATTDTSNVIPTLTSAQEQAIRDQMRAAYQSQYDSQNNINSIRSLFAKARNAQNGDAGFGQSDLGANASVLTEQQNQADLKKIDAMVAAEAAKEIARQNGTLHTNYIDQQNLDLNRQKNTQQQLQDYIKNNLDAKKFSLDYSNTMSDNANKTLTTLLTQFGGVNWDSLDPTSQQQLSETAKTAGFPLDVFKQGLQTIAQQRLADQQNASLPQSAKEFLFMNSLSPDQQAAYNAYQNADANRKRTVVNNIIGGSGMNAKQQAIFQHIVDKYNGSPLIKALDRLPVLTDTIKQVKSTPGNGALQLNLAYSYIQALDTYQSSVREGELNLVNSIDSKVGQLQNTVQQIQNGQVVRPEVAKQLADAAQNLVNTISSAAATKTKSFTANANVSGVGEAWNQYTSSLTPQTETSAQTQTVKLGGKDVQVGQIIQNSKGQQGRVNADGSITPL